MKRTLKHIGRSLALSFALGHPLAAHADAIELSQAQMRQLVVSQQVLGADQVVGAVSRNYGGAVMDIRGFYTDGAMTYRLLVQRQDGAVLEVLVNGVNGQAVSHDTPLGQGVSAVARNLNSQAARTQTRPANTQRSAAGNANRSEDRGQTRATERSNSNDNSNRGGKGHGRNK